MNTLSLRRHVSILSCFLLTISSIVFVKAKEIPNNTNSCSDVIIVFARGSSSNPENKYIDIPFDSTFAKEEEVPGAFFHWMELRLKADYPHIDYKAVSVHDSGNGWSKFGYPAVGVFTANPFNQNFHNMVQGEFSWYSPGQYNTSIGSGSDEMVGYVRDSIKNCPNQRIVVGGYSQGAHVVHESLKKLTQAERNQVDNAVLFGDPKFLGSKYNKYNLLDTPQAYPWHRGTAGLRERGIADAEDPYVPADMTFKTISWCHEDDFVCTGFSGLGWSILRANETDGTSVSSIFGAGHTRYPVFGVPESTEEVVKDLKPLLEPLEITRGGINPSKDPTVVTYAADVKNNRAVDVVFALNNVDGNDDSRAQYFLNLGRVLDDYKNQFTNVTFGGAVYGDIVSSESTHVSGYTQAFNNLSTSVDSLKSYSPYIYGLAPGGDYPENHGMAIERIGMATNWRPQAVKHIVLFAERPAHNSYVTNICDTTVSVALQFGPTSPCLEAKFSTKSQPQYCDTILLVLSGETCNNSNHTNTHIVSRTLEDALTLARAKGFVIDVVVPHTPRNNITGFTPEGDLAQLKILAESTGGLYLKYGEEAGYASFDESALRNAVWRILNHQPKLQNITQFTSGSLLNFNEQKAASFETINQLQPIQDTPLHIITTPISGAQSYVWDFESDGKVDEITSASTTEHVFTNNSPSLMTVTASTSPTGTGEVISSKVILLQAVTAKAQDSYVAGQVIDPPSSIKATTKTDGSIEVSWNVSGKQKAAEGQLGILVFTDPTSGAVIATVSVKRDSVTFDNGSVISGVLGVQYVTAAGESDIERVVVEKAKTTSQLATNKGVDVPAAVTAPSQVVGAFSTAPSATLVLGATTQASTLQNYEASDSRLTNDIIELTSNIKKNLNNIQNQILSRGATSDLTATLVKGESVTQNKKTNTSGLIVGKNTFLFLLVLVLTLGLFVFAIFVLNKQKEDED